MQFFLELKVQFSLVVGCLDWSSLLTALVNYFLRCLELSYLETAGQNSLMYIYLYIILLLPIWWFNIKFNFTILFSVYTFVFHLFSSLIIFQLISFSKLKTKPKPDTNLLFLGRHPIKSPCFPVVNNYKTKIIGNEPKLNYS